MTVTTANALHGYFETLYDLNRNLIMCCGLDVIDNSGEYEKPLQEIVQDIPRLIPYSYNKGTSLYVIDKKGGLLEFTNELPFLLEKYDEILKDNYSFLLGIIKVRNKYEHKMHEARIASSNSGGMSLFAVTYDVDGLEISLSATQFIMLIKHLNELFLELQQRVLQFAYEQGKSDYSYFQRLTRYNFCNFNKIYDSSLLRDFGQALFPF